MNLVPDWYGPVADHDALDDFHTAGGVVAGSVSVRHRGLMRQLAFDSIVEMRCRADGTPAAAAMLAGIIDGLDLLTVFEDTLSDEAA
jgi:hypothetical protein